MKRNSIIFIVSFISIFFVVFSIFFFKSKNAHDIIVNINYSDNSFLNLTRINSISLNNEIKPLIRENEYNLNGTDIYSHTSTIAPYQGYDKFELTHKEITLTLPIQNTHDKYIVSFYLIPLRGAGILNIAGQQINKKFNITREGVYLLEIDKSSIINNELKLKLNNASINHNSIIINPSITVYPKNSFSTWILKKSYCTKLIIDFPKKAVKDLQTINISIGNNTLEINKDNMKNFILHDIAGTISLEISNINIKKQYESNIPIAASVINWKNDTPLLIKSITASIIAFLILLSINYLLKKRYGINIEFYKSRFSRVFIINDHSKKTGCGKNDLLIILFIIISVVLFNLPLINTYFPISEGWFSYFAQLINSGDLPYKNFYHHLPPVYVYIISLFTKIFGYKIIYLRIMGLALILCISILTYLIYCFIFPPIISGIITIFSIIVFQSAYFLIIYDYNIITFLFTLMLLYALVLFLKTNNTKRSWLLLLIISLLSAIYIFTKQNNGLIIIFIINLILITLRINKYHSGKKILINLTIYNMFLLFFSFVFLIIMYKADILTPFINQVFLDTTKSKGSITTILFGWIYNDINLKNLIMLFFIISLLFLSSKKSKDISPKKSSYCPLIIVVLTITFLSMSSIFFPSIIVRFFTLNSFLNLIDSFRLILFVLPVLIIYFNFYKKPVSIDNALIIAISFFSLGMVAFTTTSSQCIMFFAGFISFGLLFGIFLINKSSLIKITAFFILTFFIISIISVRIALPFQWWGMKETFTPTKNRINHEYLSGFNVSEMSADMYNHIIQTISTYSQPSDTIFSYPHMPIFYLLSGNNTKTFAKVHWYDVAPDKVCVSDLSLLINEPPKIIVFLDDMSQKAIFQHEVYFKKSEPSEQRKITQWILNSIENGLYQQEQVFILGPELFLRILIKNKL